MLRSIPDIVPQAHDEAFEQQCARARRVEPAAFGVEELHRVKLADRSAVGALHVVGENLKLGLAVGGRPAVEEHGFHRLLGVGLLRTARDLDLAEIGAGCLAVQHAAYDLARAAGLTDMLDAGDDLVGR